MPEIVPPGDMIYGTRYPSEMIPVKPTAEEVRDSLRRTQEFLREHPEIIASLAEIDPYMPILRRMDQEAAQFDGRE